MIIKEVLVGLNPEALLLPNHDSALVGYTDQCGHVPVAIYSVSKILENLEAKGMTQEGALEWLTYNMTGAYMEHGPLYLWEE